MFIFTPCERNLTGREKRKSELDVVDSGGVIDRILKMDGFALEIGAEWTVLEAAGIYD